jgi:hypothetical protein
MIERNLLDQTKDLRGPQRMVQSNFGNYGGAKTDSGAESGARIVSERTSWPQGNTKRCATYSGS